jgi:hypothetical protein
MLNSLEKTYWIPAKQLLRLSRFPTHHEAVQKGIVSTQKPPIRIFVSHRWDTPDHPDPQGNRLHIIIRFIFESICLSLGVCERFFSYSEPEIILNPSLSQHIQNHHPKEIGYNEDPLWFDGFLIETLLSSWLKRNFPFLVVKADEVLAVSRIMSDIGIWYDYTCIPQKPFKPESDEQIYFNSTLARLSSIIKESHVLIAWDKQSNNRGWCIFEGIVAEKEKVANYDAVPNTNWKIAVFNLDNESNNVHPNRQIAHYLNRTIDLLVKKDVRQLKQYFESQNIVCTVKEDEEVACKLIYNYLHG